MTSSLSQSAIAVIEKLHFDPQAEMLASYIPLASIFWSDELPPKKFLEFSDTDDRNFAMRLFAIRINFWNNGEMSGEEMSFWEDAKARFPAWPIFQRLELTADSREAHERAQKESEAFFSQMCEDADELELSQDGDYTSFAAKFKITDD